MASQGKKKVGLKLDPVTVGKGHQKIREMQEL